MYTHAEDTQIEELYAGGVGSSLSPTVSHAHAHTVQAGAQQFFACIHAHTHTHTHTHAHTHTHRRVRSNPARNGPRPLLPLSRKKRQRTHSLLATGTLQ